MRLKAFFLILSLLAVTSCCGTPKEPEIVTKVEYVFNELKTQPRPDPIDLYSVKFKVVSDENLEQFLEDVPRPSGEVVFIALKIRDYEKLSLNVAELKRYIQQQKNLILYYEDIISDNNSKNKE
jgi:hypothetical protein